MTVTASLAISPSKPAAGTAITATYSVQGAAGAAQAISFSGTVTVNGTAYPGSAGSLSLPGAAPAVTFSAPAGGGLTFAATSKAGTYTATVPATGPSGAAVITGSVTVGGATLKPTASVTLPGAPVPPVTPPPAASACLFGVWDDASGYPPDGVTFSWAGVQKFAAAPVRSATYYMSWLAPFPAGLNTLAKANGATLYLNLEPWNTWGGGANPTMADIAAGKYDSWLTGLGQSIKSGGNICRVTWAHEMNGNGWYPWQQSSGVTPAQWITGWTHVYQAIKAAAGSLAQMVWCPNNIDVGSAAPYYPGEPLVDVMAMDAYLNTASASQTYAQFVKQTVDQLSSLDGRPVWNAETGVLGTNREARIAQFVQDMHADGRVSGLTIFNEGAYLLDASETAALCAAVNAWNAG